MSTRTAAKKAPAKATAKKAPAKKASPAKATARPAKKATPAKKVAAPVVEAPAAPVFVQLYAHGRAIAASQNKISSVAYYSTKGIDDLPRVTTARLVELLAAEGVTSPTTTSWDVVLPNGVKLSARVEGDAREVPGAGEVRERQARRASGSTRSRDRVNAVNEQIAAARAAKLARKAS